MVRTNWSTYKEPDVETCNAPAGQSGDDLLRPRCSAAQSDGGRRDCLRCLSSLLAGSGAFARYLREFHLRRWPRAGVLACRFLEGRSYMRRWLLYVYALAFLVSGFLCVLQWFEVSGATGFRY